MFLPGHVDGVDFLPSEWLWAYSPKLLGGHHATEPGELPLLDPSWQGVDPAASEVEILLGVVRRGRCPCRRSVGAAR